MTATKSFSLSTNSSASAALLQMEMDLSVLGFISLNPFISDSIFSTIMFRDTLEPMTAPSLLTPLKISPVWLFLRATAYSFIMHGDASGGQNKVPGVLCKVSFSKTGSCLGPSAGKIPHSIGQGLDDRRKSEFCALTSFLKAAC